MARIVTGYDPITHEKLWRDLGESRAHSAAIGGTQVVGESDYQRQRRFAAEHKVRQAQKAQA